MCLTQDIVVNVVCGRHLQASSTKLYVYISVFNNRYHAVYQWHHHLMSAQPLVFGVFRVNAHGGIAHDGFGSSGGHHGIVSSVGILVQHLAIGACGHHGVSVGIGHIVAQVKQVAFLFTINHLLGREHGLCLRVPVYHAQSAVDKAFFVEVDKHLQYAF